jgi:hypothetical protein
MIIETRGNEVVFRIKKSANIDYLQDFANLFDFTETVSKSKAKQKDIDSLAKIVKKGLWDKTKLKIGL